MPTLTDQTLRDLEAIRRIKGLYCDTIDRIMRQRDPADAALLRSLWTEDAVFDFSQLDGTVYEGPAAIVDIFVKLLPARVCWMWHTVGAEVIDIDGDTATGCWTLVAMAQPVGGEGKPALGLIARR